MTDAAVASGVRLAELAASFSLVGDLALGQPMEHALRTCLLADSLGEALGQDDRALGEVYYVALLRSVGCAADAHQLGQWFGDEIDAWAASAALDPLRPPELLRFLAQRVGRGRSLLDRLGLLAGVATRLPAAARDLFRPHGRSRRPSSRPSPPSRRRSTGSSASSPAPSRCRSTSPRGTSSR